MSNPYIDILEMQNWKNATQGFNLFNISPAHISSFDMKPDMKIMSLGSCFAQHLTKHLEKLGFKNLYFETGGQQDDSYRVFSARYGNIYTARQALQLFRRAFGEASSMELWIKDGNFYDPYRPNAIPGGFGTVNELLADRENHLKIVRQLFIESDVIVLTLGLTEGWYNKENGAIYPIAPGVMAGEYDTKIHGFFNERVTDVMNELDLLISGISQVNKKVSYILTVSPVPLAATFEKTHVINATSYSKSVLRVAAQEMELANTNVHYFPSYEIITSPIAQGRYYENDFRHVRDIGVQRVMTEFQKTFVLNQQGLVKKEDENSIIDYETSAEIVCDEEELLKLSENTIQSNFSQRIPRLHSFRRFQKMWKHKD